MLFAITFQRFWNAVDLVDLKRFEKFVNRLIQFFWKLQITIIKLSIPNNNYFVSFPKKSVVIERLYLKYVDMMIDFGEWTCGFYLRLTEVGILFVFRVALSVCIRSYNIVSFKPAIVTLIYGRQQTEISTGYLKGKQKQFWRRIRWHVYYCGLNFGIVPRTNRSDPGMSLNGTFWWRFSMHMRCYRRPILRFVFETYRLNTPRQIMEYLPGVGFAINTPKTEMIPSMNIYKLCIFDVWRVRHKRVQIRL